MMNIRYIGNGAYCYANSLAMLLANTGADYDPGYLECLTGVAISATRVDTKWGPLPFFSIGLPDEGISVALRHLGFEFDRAFCSRLSVPDWCESVGTLRKAIDSGPVLVGPLDMSRLTYLPDYQSRVGADHFVVVFALSEDGVLLHDPEGFAYAMLHLDDFLHAWRGENIAYRPDVYPQGAYSMWWNVRRTRHPTKADTFALTDQYVRDLLRWQAEHGDDNFGCEMIRQLAGQARNGVPESMSGQLSYFALPLGARRCADFAQFYASFDGERAHIKAGQGQCFSKAAIAFRQQDYGRLSTLLYEIADYEEQFQQLTLA